MSAGLFLVPGLGGFLLPASWRDSVLQLLPSNTTLSFTSVHGDPTMLGVGAGAAVFAVWVVGLLGTAAVVLRRRSA